MDMRVDEARHDEAARMIVDRRVFGGLAENVARLADRCDPPVGDQHRSILEIAAGGRAGFGGIVAERQDAAADDARCRTQGRMSFRRAAAMRSISAKAVAVSVS